MRWYVSQSIKRMVAAALTLSIQVGAYGQETRSTLNSAAAEAREAGIAEYRLGHFAEADLLLRRALEYSDWRKILIYVHCVSLKSNSGVLTANL